MITKYDKKYTRIALVALAILFMFVGMLTSLNDLLVPIMKKIFNLNYKQSLTIQVVWFTSFTIVGYPFGAITRKHSHKLGMASGYFLATIGCLLFCSAWWLNTYWSFLVAIFVLSCGVCFLNVVSNPYAIHLGDPKNASKRLVILHSFFAVGTTIAPIFASLLMSSDLTKYATNILESTIKSEMQHESIKIMLVYLLFFLISALLFIVTILLPLPNILKNKQIFNKKQEDNIKSVWNYPHTILGAISAFFCVGCETLAVSFIIIFAKNSNINLNESNYPILVSLFWAGILAGRLSGPLIFRLWKPNNILLFCTLVCAILFLCPLFINGLLAVSAIVLIGLFNSVMYPIIYSAAMKSLPPSTAIQASSIVSIAIIGGAIMPLLGALIADAKSIEYSFVIGAIGFLFIAIFPIYNKVKNLDT
jgi:FHS family L-fucose permease-like MFS transporter